MLFKTITDFARLPPSEHERYRAMFCNKTESAGLGLTWGAILPEFKYMLKEDRLAVYDLLCGTYIQPPPVQPPIDEYVPTCGTRSEGYGLTWGTLLPQFAHMPFAEREYLLAKMCPHAPPTPPIETPEMNTIEFQELIPGIKPPRVPLLIPLLESLPLLPGWTIRDPAGNIINKGIDLPVLMIPPKTERPPVREPEFRDSCAVEGSRTNGLVCYNGQWVLSYMVPRDYGECFGKDGTVSKDGNMICVGGRWTDRYRPVAPQLGYGPGEDNIALGVEEEEMEL